MIDTKWLLGIRFDRIDAEQALAMMRERTPDASFAYVVTLNADHMIRLDRAGRELHAVYQSAWLSLCDSRVLCLLAARQNIQLSLAAGSDLTQLLFDCAIEPHTPVTIIGSTVEAVDLLRARFGLQRLFQQIPPMGFIHDPNAVADTVRFVRNHPAHYVFLCVGSPQQEILAAAIAADGNASGIGLCVGAAIDFVTGIKRRAPIWVQRAHVEWLHRLCREPGRLWRRYIFGIPRLLVLMHHVPRDGSARQRSV